MADLYCIDSSSVIQLARYLPQSVLGPLWELLDTLADEKRLLAPREVLREVSKRDDLALAWARDHKSIFVDLDAEQGAMVRKLQTDYPVLNDPNRPLNADPWCLGLTLLKTQAGEPCHLVNEEKDTALASNKLPYLCRQLKLKSAKLLEVPGLEGLRFTLSKQ